MFYVDIRSIGRGDPPWVKNPSYKPGANPQPLFSVPASRSRQIGNRCANDSLSPAEAMARLQWAISCRVLATKVVVGMLYELDEYGDRAKLDLPYYPLFVKKSKLDNVAAADLWKPDTASCAVPGDIVYATVTISALQIGGNVEQLSQIMRKDDDAEGLYFVQCSIENKSDCKKALEKIIVYASGDFPGQFANMAYNPSIPGGPAFISYETRGYHEYGLTELYPNPSPILESEIQASRRQLARHYQVLSRDWERSQDLVHFFRLTDEELKRVAGIAQIIAENKAKVVGVGQLCYEKPYSCVTETAKIYAAGTSVLKDYNPADLVKECA